MDAAQFGELLSIPSENSSFTLAAWKLSPKFRGIGSVDKVRGPFSFRRNVRVSAIFWEKKQRFEKFDSLGSPDSKISPRLKFRLKRVDIRSKWGNFVDSQLF